MSVNSAMLFPLPHETQTEPATPSASRTPKGGPLVSVVKAGELSVRMKKRRENESLLARLNYQPEISVPEEISELLGAQIASGVPMLRKTTRPTFDFRDHCRRLVGTTLGVFGILGVFGGLVGLCAFLVGVALPFGFL